MSTLIILRGNSGSGKSSTARELQRRLGTNTMLLSQDMIRREILKVPDGADTEALSLLALLLQYGAEHCPTVILEGILYADWYRPLFCQAVSLFGDRICAYYYDLPFEETLRRHQTRSKCAEFGAVEMRRWWREKDMLDIIPEKILGESMTLEAAVNLICTDLRILSQLHE